jgi:hypothetical protein
MTQLIDATLAAESVIGRLPQTGPDNEFNRVLLGNVHPVHWTNPTHKKRYNLVVIGAAGLVTSAIAAALGANVALIERDLPRGVPLPFGIRPHSRRTLAP